MTSHSPSHSPSPSPSPELVGLLDLKIDLGLWAGFQRIFINVEINK